MGPKVTRGVIAALVAAASIGATSCQKLLGGKDEAKCQQGLTTTRTALEQENFELVQQWRAYAYKQCEDRQALSALDQEIQAKQAAIADREAKSKTAKQIAKLLVSFAGQHMSAPSGQCFTKGHPEQGWCKRTRTLTSTSATFDVKYREEEKDWVRFDTLMPGGITCADLGASEVRTWKVTKATGGTAKRIHCQLGAGPLSGFHGLISVESDGTRVALVSAKDLSHDAALRRQLDMEGK